MKAKTRGLNLFDKILLAINYLLILALLISFLAEFVKPATSGIIALFGLAYPPLLLLNSLLIVYWLLRRRWYFLLSLTGILIGWNDLANTIGFHASSADVVRPAGTTLRIITYNVHEFVRYNTKHDTSTKHEILQLLLQQQPDIVGFQEFRSSKKGTFDMIDSLKSTLKMDYCYFEPFTSDFRKSIGMAIISKYPIVAKGYIQLSELDDENQCLYVDVKMNEKVFRYYSVHLKSIKFDPKDYSYIDSVSKKGKANMRSTKIMKNKLINAFVGRSAQVLKLKDSLANCPYPYIIAGDFNDTPTSYAVNQMAKGLKNAFREKGSGIGKTYNGDFPNYQIDYIMTSPRFDIASYKVIEKKLSDHYPVRSDVILK